MSNNTPDRFPCASLVEALPHLRRPPRPTLLRFKIQTIVGNAAQVVAYLDARFVFDRLDQVCAGEWSARSTALPARLIPAPVDRQGEAHDPPPLYVRCRLTALGVTREDVGEGSDPKAAFSDAIKRAAVHFGIGRALYALRSPWLREGDGEAELRRNRAGKLVLDRRTEAWCRGRYARWLEEYGARQFGEPLDHTAEQVVVADRTEPASTRRLDLQLVDRRRRSAGYGREVVRRLAAGLYRQPQLGRLTQPQAADLAQVLELAGSGAMNEQLLSRCVARLAGKADQERPLAIRAFRRYLADRGRSAAGSDERTAV